MPHRALCGPIVAHFCFVFSGFENAVSAPSLRTNYIPLGLESCWGLAVSHACRTEPFADRLWHAFALFLAVSKMPFRHPICGRITYRFVFGGFEDAVSAPSLRTNYTPWLESGCFACMPHRALCGPIVTLFCFVFSGFEEAVSAPSLRTNYLPLGLESCWGSPFCTHAAQSPLRRDCGTLTHGFWLGLLRHPVCGRITYPLGLNPAGVSLFGMHAAQSPLRTDCGTLLLSFKEVAWYAVFEACLSEFEKWHFDVF